MHLRETELGQSDGLGDGDCNELGIVALVAIPFPFSVSFAFAFPIITAISSLVVCTLVVSLAIFLLVINGFLDSTLSVTEPASEAICKCLDDGLIPVRCS
jgi:hypothetical protein